MILTIELHSSETHEDKWLMPGSKTLRGISMSLKKEGRCVVVEADTNVQGSGACPPEKKENRREVMHSDIHVQAITLGLQLGLLAKLWL